MVTDVLKNLNPAVEAALDRFATSLDSEGYRVDLRMIGERAFTEVSRPGEVLLFGPRQPGDDGDLELRATLPDLPNDCDLRFCLSGPAGPRRRLMRGVEITSLHDGIARLVGLPDAWLAQQVSALDDALRPALGDASRMDLQERAADLARRASALAHLRLTHSGDKIEPQGWLEERLFGARGATRTLGALYLQAEAGRGKTTLLASLCSQQLRTGHGPFPLFLPLRDLPPLRNATALRWGDVAARIGAVGDACDRLRLAIRAGLVVAVLDGVDEVSQTYDRNLIRGVFDIVFESFYTQHARILISGRTTEASVLRAHPSTAGDAGTRCEFLGLELPPPEDEQFSIYVRRLVDDTLRRWSAFSTTEGWRAAIAAEGILPPTPEMRDVGWLAGAPEMTDLSNWVRHAVLLIGHESSLFFVQSLSIVGRYRQMAGISLFRGGAISFGSDTNADRLTYETALVAACLACGREREKIRDSVKDRFTVTAQLDTLSWYAGGEDGRMRPDDVAELAVFGSGGSEPEDYFAVVGQMQKHALLCNGEVSAGKWRPAFLNPWVRAALLVRAWRRLSDDRHRAKFLSLVPDVGVRDARAIIARSGAVLAFSDMFPHEPSNSLKSLNDALKDQVRDCPEAASNLFALCAKGGTLDAWARAFVDIGRFPDLTNLSGVRIEGVTISNFIFRNALLMGAEFVACSFSRVTFVESDLSGAEFRACTFNGGTFRHVDGPVTFEDCQFRTSTFSDVQLPGARWMETVTGRPAALRFYGCEFQAVEMSQSKAVCEHDAQSAAFEQCSSDRPVQSMLRGERHGLPTPVPGLTLRTETPADGAAITLRRILLYFFPRHAGESDRRQVRASVKVTTVGRGAFPKGAPTPDRLLEILAHFGFGDGGRPEFLYAPWSPLVAGDGSAIRGEMAEFLRTGKVEPGTELARLYGLLSAEFHR